MQYIYLQYTYFPVKIAEVIQEKCLDKFSNKVS